MKKYIIIALLVFSPMFASAQTVDTQAGIEFLSPLVQNIIQLLYDRISELTAQVAFLKAQQPVCQSFGTINQNVLSNPTEQVTMTQVDNSDIVVTLNSSQTAEKSGTPHGEFVYKVVILDAEGKKVNGQNVHLDPVPNDNLNAWHEDTLNRLSDNAYFAYMPTSAGTKTLTFSSGNLSKTVTVEVK